jgi:phosphonoacetaldehyde hydrolase
MAAEKRIKALIFDWAGTTVDHGSLAPVRTLERVLLDAGIVVPEMVIRRDMGLAKLDHITRLLAEPEVVAAWKAAHGEAPPKRAAGELYQAFLPLQMECLLAYSHVLPGVPEAVAVFEARGLRIASTTGYTRAMLDVLAAAAAEEGYKPEIAMSPEDVGAGRPSPAMCLEICSRFEIEPWECIKIGDTPSDIAEGRNAGMWTIGISRTGNMIGLNQSDWERLDGEEQQERLAWARNEFMRAGSNGVAESVAECRHQVDAMMMQASQDGRP